MLSSGGTGCFILIATLETSLEANYERQAGRQEGRQEDRRKKSLIGAQATALPKNNLLFTLYNENSFPHINTVGFYLKFPPI